jgi:hypothetical protein
LRLVLHLNFALDEDDMTTCLLYMYAM